MKSSELLATPDKWTQGEMARAPAGVIFSIDNK